jgi:ParB-like chromosome segregation protein Spo0J
VSIQPFDPTLAELPVRTLTLDRVVDLLEAAPPHAPERVAAYAGAMAAGQRFPPVAVIRLGGRYVVADGHKRLMAFRTLGQSEIPVEVWTLRRFLRDQRHQARANSRKIRTILAGFLFDRRESRRLLLTGVGHWWRVARSLAAHAAPRRRSDPGEPGR